MGYGKKTRAPEENLSLSRYVRNIIQCLSYVSSFIRTIVPYRVDTLYVALSVWKVTGKLTLYRVFLAGFWETARESWRIGIVTSRNRMRYLYYESVDRMVVNQDAGFFFFFHPPRRIYKEDCVKMKRIHAVSSLQTRSHRSVETELKLSR